MNNRRAAKRLSFTETAEYKRMPGGDERKNAWRRWGPYVSERGWGTARENTGDSSDAWSHFPFEHARSRAYRWSEDGLAGFCDADQTLCMSLALWNGRDSILKERPFG